MRSTAQVFEPMMPDHELPTTHLRDPHRSSRHQELDRVRFPRQSRVGPHVYAPPNRCTFYPPHRIYSRGNGYVLFAIFSFYVFLVFGSPVICSMTT